MLAFEGTQPKQAQSHQRTTDENILDMLKLIDTKLTLFLTIIAIMFIISMCGSPF